MFFISLLETIVSPSPLSAEGPKNFEAFLKRVALVLFFFLVGPESQGGMVFSLSSFFIFEMYYT